MNAPAPENPKAEAIHPSRAVPTAAPWRTSASLVLACVLVIGMTLGLESLHDVIARQSEVSALRPYGIAFVLIVAAMTFWGGLFAGAFTAVLSVLALGLYLIPNSTVAGGSALRGWVELILLGIVNLVVIYAIHTAQQQRRKASDSLDEMREAQARLRAILDTAPVGVISCEADGALQFANSEAERILGHGLVQTGMAQQDAYRVLTADGEPVAPEQMGLARALRGEAELVQDDGIIERPDQSRVWFVSRSKAVREGPNEPILGAVSAFVDVTRQREAEIEREGLLQTLLLHRPDHIPGLDLAVHYGPAQAEVRVGGDFYDIFPLEGDCTALVIGDLSGKGVPAAAQVAMVRNMLRFALYQGRPLPETLNLLNDTLASRRLLQGFATLFVGVYDPASGGMIYASCGHEPGLLRRADRRVEELAPTGPILGAFEEARFDEERVSLRAGDALALYTDGISEAGRIRRDFLGTERLAGLLSNSGAVGASASSLLDRIIAGVDAHAPGPLHDDRCLLVALPHFGRVPAEVGRSVG